MYFQCTIFPLAPTYCSICNLNVEKLINLINMASCFWLYYRMRNLYAMLIKVEKAADGIIRDHVAS